MRILSWNINGVRTIPHYHPWNKCKNWDAILQELKADIICFQEIKTTRTAIGRTVAFPDNFDAFLSFPASKGGYSGVAVYTDSRTVVPLKAEEGLSGRLQPKPPLTPEERVSRSYPYAHEMDLMPDLDGNTPSDLATLDWEGRGLVLDFGLFVLINLYCPNETSDERLPYKMNYHFMLQERVRKLVEEEKREVIVVGDINVCATPLDHCDGHLPSNASTFWDHPARAWFHNWLEPNGPMIDIVRRFWPGRKGMYTCWNTKISARETNYGTRIDYILITPGLLSWVKHGDILPDIKGSDHCPIYIDLHEEITTETGEKLSLRDAMKIDGRKRDPPRIATKFWDEHRRKQTLLSGFFGKGNGTKSPPDVAVISPPETVSQPSVEEENTPSSIGQSSLAAAFDALESSRALPHIVDTPDVDQTEPTPSRATSAASSRPSPAISTSTQASTTSRTTPKNTQPTSSPPTEASRPSQQSRKRRRPEPTPSTAGPFNSQKAKKQKAGQTKLSSFFAKPSTARRTSSEVIEFDDDPDPEPAASSQSAALMDCDDLERQIDADHRLAQELAASQEGTGASEPVESSSKEVWSTLFAPVQPPKCIVHGELAKEFRVNKPGPNKGKTFFVCSRPVGPGYDKGRSERLREEVDHQYKCNFFKWASEVKKEALRASGNGSKK